MALNQVSERPRTKWTGFEPCAYLTDGERLFRVVRGFAWPPEGTRALLEDCRTLETRDYTPVELWEMGIRLVRGPGPR